MTSKLLLMRLVCRSVATKSLKVYAKGMPVVRMDHGKINISWTARINSNEVG